jgi:hypothetical protein
MMQSGMRRCKLTQLPPEGCVRRPGDTPQDAYVRLLQAAVARIPGRDGPFQPCRSIPRVVRDLRGPLNLGNLCSFIRLSNPKGAARSDIEKRNSEPVQACSAQFTPKDEDVV